MMKEKLKTYYFYENIKKDKKYKKWVRDCQKYLNVLRMIKEKHSIRETSRKLKVARETIRKWVRGKTAPYLIRIIDTLPKLNSKKCRWLPLKIHRQGKIRKYNLIKVPTVVKNYNDLLMVINEISKKTNLWPEDMVEAIAYILGMLISDAGKRLETLSTQISLSLSRKYNWNISLGKAFCNYLSKISIKSRRYKDNTSKHHNEFVWCSENSPLITWLIRSCLGLKKGDTTTYNSVNANWILSSPKSFRVPFLQGICDGDGSAGIKGWRISRASHVNKEFLKKLLKTFNIESLKGDEEVYILKKESIERAVNLPMFKHAKGRLKNARKIVKMLKCSNPRGTTNIDLKIIKEIFILRAKGFSIGEISEKIFDKLKVGIRPSGIYSILKRGKKAYKIDYDLVNMYFSLLENPYDKDLRENIDYNSFYRWTHNKVPLDVKRVLSLGFEPKQIVIKKFPFFKEYCINKNK